MIFPSNRVRIMVATKPVDVRKGHDGLAALVSNELRKAPFTGTVVVFRSRRADRLKLLYWDDEPCRAVAGDRSDRWRDRRQLRATMANGLVMAFKRLEDHSFTWPAIRDELMTLSHARFAALFAGLDWRRVRAVSARAPEAVNSCARMARTARLTRAWAAGCDKRKPCCPPPIFPMTVLP